MSLDDSVPFLERVARTQSLQHELERRRLALDRRLDTAAPTIDARISGPKIERLERYYRKICEDERRSRIRHEKIRQDMARANSRLDWMARRTDKFKALKEEYERLIEAEFPGWLRQLPSVWQKIEEEKMRNLETGQDRGTNHQGQAFAPAALPHPPTSGRSPYQCVQAAPLVGQGYPGQMSHFPGGAALTVPPLLTLSSAMQSRDPSGFESSQAQLLQNPVYSAPYQPPGVPYQQAGVPYQQLPTSVAYRSATSVPYNLPGGTMPYQSMSGPAPQHFQAPAVDSLPPPIPSVPTTTTQIPSFPQSHANFPQPQPRPQLHQNPSVPDPKPSSLVDSRNHRRQSETKLKRPDEEGEMETFVGGDGNYNENRKEEYPAGKRDTMDTNDVAKEVDHLQLMNLRLDERVDAVEGSMDSPSKKNLPSRGYSWSERGGRGELEGGRGELEGGRGELEGGRGELEGGRGDRDDDLEGGDGELAGGRDGDGALEGERKDDCDDEVADPSSRDDDDDTRPPPSSKRGIISIPSANLDEDDDGDVDDDSDRNDADKTAPRVEDFQAASPTNLEFSKPSKKGATSGGGGAATLDFESSLGSTASEATLPEMSPAARSASRPASSKKDKSLRSPVGADFSLERNEDDEDDIFSRGRKADVGIGFAYEQMKMTLGGGGGDSAKKTAAAAKSIDDSDSEDELEAAIQKAVMGNAAAAAKPPADAVSVAAEDPKSPTSSSSRVDEGKKSKEKSKTTSAAASASRGSSTVARLPSGLGRDDDDDDSDWRAPISGRGEGDGSGAVGEDDDEFDFYD